jgi:hypothetical protein
LAEIVIFRRIVMIMGRQLENAPNSQYMPTYYIAKLLDNGNARLNAKDFNEDLQKNANYNGLRIAWLNIRTANIFISLS